MPMVLFHLQNRIFLCDEVLHNVKDVRLVQGVDVNLVLTLQHRRCAKERQEKKEEKSHVQFSSLFSHFLKSQFWSHPLHNQTWPKFPSLTRYSSLLDFTSLQWPQLDQLSDIKQQLFDSDWRFNVTKEKSKYKQAKHGKWSNEPWLDGQAQGWGDLLFHHNLMHGAVL